MEPRDPRSPLLDPPVNGPQGPKPSTSATLRWPQAPSWYVCQSPQGCGEWNAAQPLIPDASKVKAQPDPMRVSEEFKQFGKLLPTLLYGTGGSGTIQPGQALEGLSACSFWTELSTCCR